MSRFIQAAPAAKPAKDKKPTPKFGPGAASRQTDYSKLGDVKKIPTAGGYK